MATRFTYGLKYTRNLGNFENVTPYFEISDDLRDGESFDSLIGRVTGKVERLMEDKIAEIDEDAK